MSNGLVYHARAQIYEEKNLTNFRREHDMIRCEDLKSHCANNIENSLQQVRCQNQEGLLQDLVVPHGDNCEHHLSLNKT